MKTFAFRLHPHQDLLLELEMFARAHGLRAAFVMTCVGSLRHAALRLANKDDTTHYEDKFEILSLVGTLSPDGAHLHIALADGAGRTVGGHVMAGNLVYTTAEIVVGELDDLVFTRPVDPETTYDELHIDRR
jgi:predicted DNA-binding protein with PD1-like motif